MTRLSSLNQSKSRAYSDALFCEPIVPDNSTAEMWDLGIIIYLRPLLSLLAEPSRDLTLTQYVHMNKGGELLPTLASRHLEMNNTVALGQLYLLQSSVLLRTSRD